MTITSVVGGIATLGTLEAAADCDCAADAAGIAAISKGIMNFIGLSFQPVFVQMCGTTGYHMLIWMWRLMDSCKKFSWRRESVLCCGGTPGYHVPPGGNG